MNLNMLAHRIIENTVARVVIINLKLKSKLRNAHFATRHLRGNKVGYIAPLVAGMKFGKVIRYVVIAVRGLGGIKIESFAPQIALINGNMNRIPSVVKSAVKLLLGGVGNIVLINVWGGLIAFVIWDRIIQIGEVVQYLITGLIGMRLEKGCLKEITGDANYAVSEVT